MTNCTVAKRSHMQKSHQYGNPHISSLGSCRTALGGGGGGVLGEGGSGGGGGGEEEDGRSRRRVGGGRGVGFERAW